MEKGSRSMKRIILATIISASPLVLADISLGTPKGSVSQPAAQEYADVAQEVLQSVKELTAILKTISDQASADAAAPQVASQVELMIAIQKKAELMPKPANQVELLVKNSINMQEVQQVAKDFLNAVIQIGMNNGYGSQPLLDALSPVLGASIAPTEPQQ